MAAELDKNRTEQIAHEVIRVLYGRFQNFPEDSTNNRNAPFHEAFLNAFSNKLGDSVKNVPFFVSLSSWLHGLNTTLGQTFFENVAHILSAGEKKSFTSKKNSPLTISSGQRETISTIITELKNTSRTPILEREDSDLAKASAIGDSVTALDFTVDNFFDEGDGETGTIVAIELKAVRPNAGELRGEKTKVLEAKAALRKQYPTKSISFYFGFPFDPWSDTPTGCNKERFLANLIEGKKYLAKEEVLLAEELWEHLSGIKNTMQQILVIINRIATPEFMANYEFLSNHSNLTTQPEKYLALLDLWMMHGEKFLAGNIISIQKQCSVDKRLTRFLHQQVFREGSYNLARQAALAAAIKE